VSTTEEKLRNSVSQRLYTMEAVFYITVGILLAAAAVVAVFDAGMMLWRLIASGTLTNYGLLMLDRVLLVLGFLTVVFAISIYLLRPTPQTQVP